MVERPIKKSERPIAPPDEVEVETQDQPSAAQDTPEVAIALPIKKSERVIAPPSEVEAQTQDQPSAAQDTPEVAIKSAENRKVIPSIPGKERSKSRGKGSNRDEEPATPPMNMALMRGPKPTKSKPPVVVAPPEELESSSEPESELETAPQE
jgi:hypothetical protein